MKVRALFALAICVVSVSICASVSSADQFDASLLNSMLYARNQAKSIGAEIWPGYEEAPFGLLVTLENREVLFCHNSSVDGFLPLPVDQVTKCDLQERDNVYPKNLLAAFPAVEGVSTIVMGTPESTGRAREDWTRTIFHEHFHQYQSDFNDYYSRLNNLELRNGDTTGMWMLNYPFPYQKEVFVANLTEASHALHAAITSESSTFEQLVSSYLTLRQKLEITVSEKDWRYFELQLWLEGIARWTEFKISEQTSDKEIVKSGRSLRKQAVSSLLTLNPAQSGRVIVYSYGAGEAILLERCKPDWRSEYPETMSLGSLVKTIKLSDCQ